MKDAARKDRPTIRVVRARNRRCPFALSGTVAAGGVRVSGVRSRQSC
jgi:hypothetical protein